MPFDPSVKTPLQVELFAVEKQRPNVQTMVKRQSFWATLMFSRKRFSLNQTLFLLGFPIKEWK